MSRGGGNGRPSVPATARDTTSTPAARERRELGEARTNPRQPDLVVGFVALDHNGSLDAYRCAHRAEQLEESGVEERFRSGSRVTRHEQTPAAHGGYQFVITVDQHVDTEVTARRGRFRRRPEACLVFRKAARGEHVVECREVPAQSEHARVRGPHRYALFYKHFSGLRDLRQVFYQRRENDSGLALPGYRCDGSVELGVLRGRYDRT